MSKDTEITNETETTEETENEQTSTETESEHDGGQDQEVDGEEEGASQAKVKKEAPKEDPEKVVPLAALKEARYQLKQQRNEAKQLKEQYEKAESRLQEFLKKFETQQIPEFDKDPGGHLLTKQQQLERQIAEIQGKHSETQKAELERREQDAFLSRYRMAASEYAAEKPDFKEAYQFLIEARSSELRAAGFSEEKIIQRMHADEMAIVSDSFEEDINPASRLYAMASARGYKANKVNEEKQKLETLQKGLKSGKTLSNSGGSSKGLTLDTLANMTDDEFAQVDQKEVERILRGRSN